MDPLLIGVTFLETIYAVWFLLFILASLLPWDTLFFAAVNVMVYQRHYF